MTAVHTWLGVLLMAVPAVQYFPDGVFGSTTSQHRFRTEWYSKHLTAMREPSLYQLAQQDASAEAYRFLWLRTFDHPVCVRLTVRKDGTALLTSKEMDGHGGYAPGRLKLNKTTAISRDRTDWFRGQFEKRAIWNLPTRLSADGLDGAQWIIEGVKSGRYHIVDRWSPGTGDPVHDICMTLLTELAHIIPPQTAMY